ncbi:MAG: hypothetical protein COT74_03610 [Bdellovibrionales bacterium CG10_big_fil_rev_8_21_14_0_10_45_34]|nr:MAG: hypothetical protein COT74_03610 [Bdellovibrionales bacterium CG10_big_fil_rev_8_21_14_0_10_45_34]
MRFFLKARVSSKLQFTNEAIARISASAPGGSYGSPGPLKRAEFFDSCAKGLIGRDSAPEDTKMGDKPE